MPATRMTQKPAILLKYAVTLMIAAGFACCAAVDACGGSTVQTMSVSELDRVLTGKENRCFVAAMAAWCAPCKEELPALVKLYNRYQPHGFQLFGISLDLDGPAAMQPIIDRMKVNFPVYWVGEKAMEIYDITALPVIFVVKDGRIVERIIGKRPEKFLDQKIRDLLE